MQKLWILKGSMTLLSLADGFFLLKFSTAEDMEMVLSGGPWFLLGKPFILQRWSPKFKPKRDEAAPIPIWIKIVDFPLVLWTPTGISKIASYVNVPISVDTLTANHSRLTYARVCVLISKDSALPEEIPLEIEGEDLVLKVLYDWKPDKCEGCGSFIHPFSLCPKNPNPKPVLPPQPPRNRGRSTSRHHSSRPHRSPSNRPPPQSKNIVDKPLPSTAVVSNPPPLVQPQANHTDLLLASQTPILVQSQANQTNVSLPSASKTNPITNLNSPTKDSSSPIQHASPKPLLPPKIPLLNKFASLQEDDNHIAETIESVSESESASVSISVDDPGQTSKTDKNQHNTRSSSDKVKTPTKPKQSKGKSAKKAKAKISPSSATDPWFLRSHRLFENEGNYHNFGDSALGRIWIKWDSSVFSFKPISSSSQFIHSILSVGSFPPVFLSVIYASNAVEDRKHLWESLTSSSPPLDHPWVIMGDFNCYRYETEKAGGTMSSNGRLGELNSMIFNCGVQDLSSTGLFFTWYNQRADNPIHIKLDRVLVNNALLDFLPTAYYTVESHLGSDHSPLIFNSTHDKPISVRFMFKNYWINMEGYWDDVLEAFASRSARSPMASFYHSLQMLKRAFKNRNWSSSSFLSNALLEIKSKQHQCLAELQANPLDVELNHNLKKINEELASFQANWTSWLAQRAKVLWLTKGEDDLGFLFAKIRSRNNKNCIKEIVTSEGHFITFSDISKAIIKHFESLFNSSHTTPVLPFNIPTGNMVPPHFYGMLVSPLSFEEVKKAVFDGNENTAPGPDGFTYAFYRKSWHLIGLQVFNAVNNFFVTGSLPRGVKATAIALIPKCSHATNINDFRPISLCNVLYKIVAKVLSNRLKVVLPHIIHDSQSGFITTRCSTDNIILAAEILRDFKGSTKKFCAKLDIRKAFDTVSREYIIARLLQKGFPEVFVGWIKGCISDVHFSICLNGSLEGFFKSSSGLRQGCPLSPLLFCVAMDGLSQTLSDSHNFKGIKCKDVQISHLMYADDLLVVGEATIENARHLNRFYNSKNLLSRWYKAKFISPWKPWPLSASNYWKKISTTAFKIQSEIQFFVSKFSEFSFLWDPWLHGHFIEEASFADDASLVKDFYFNDTWHLPSSIPLGIRENILAVHNKGMNEVLWHGSSKWLFKNFVEVYHSSIPNVDWCNAIWHKKHTLKYAWFAWMARLGKLKTADNLLIQGIQVPQNCSLCSGMLVNHYHLFFTCDFSFFILKSILPDFNCFLLRPNLSQTYDFIENSVLYNKTEKDFCL
ncbi:uncharacterized protein LOC110115796 [Dendrobium catenatum]|uniref:uncharacterized protein LOC110115796 n=1 Tax=Dendrobium catenatum TaxID=906689 RepID=UPI0009F1E200|nr:uncharacterized protein LOC110115796 [Dendrobium catenatum]